MGREKRGEGHGGTAGCVGGGGAMGQWLHWGGQLAILQFYSCKLLREEERRKEKREKREENEGKEKKKRIKKYGKKDKR
jgi:hypothetical protein